MQQGHPHLTKENFLSDTEREVNDSTHSLTEHFFTINQCYMFIAILEVLTDWTETESINLKILPHPINTNNLSDLQKSEQLITRTAKKLNQSLFQCKNKANKNIFSEYQDTRF